jgi:hypothetical protein
MNEVVQSQHLAQQSSNTMSQTPRISQLIIEQKNNKNKDRIKIDLTGYEAQ